MGVTKFTPTAEQEHVLAVFRTGKHLVVQAGAGCGKTATLKLIADDAGTRRGQFVAFNRSIVKDAEAKFPKNVSCRTAHSLAFREVGKPFANRLRTSKRMRSSDIATRLGIDPIVLPVPGGTKYLGRGYLAGLTMRALVRYCQSADPEPTMRHVPYIDGIDEPREGHRTYANNNEVARWIEPALKRLWLDARNPNGWSPYKHDYYLKLFERSNPHLPVDFILYDEAQDASPVALSIVNQQTHAQLIGVGDSAQAINGFTGAIDALDRMVQAGAETAYLSQSFRFGQPIADVANEFLALLDTPLRLRGTEGLESYVGPLDDPSAILTRTNATAVRTVLEMQEAGRKVFLVGGGKEVASFAKAAGELMSGERTFHPDLACFDTWLEVQEYCLAPGTRVLTSDLRYQPIETLIAGDTLVGFDEESGAGNHGRRFQTATVERTREIVRPCRRIWFDDGTEVVASAEHRWLYCTTGGSQKLAWRSTESLRPGDRIASLGPSWTRDESRDGGWLAGIYDGEGWLTGDRPKGTGSVGVSQVEGKVLDQIRVLLLDRGFTAGDSIQDGCHRLTINGGLSEKLRLLGTLQPGRLVGEAEKLYRGTRVEARRWATVEGIEDVGEQTVIALKTDTGTFVAEGLLSHNCDEDEQGDELRLMVKLVDEFGVDVILGALDGQVRQQDAEVTVSTTHKVKGLEFDAVRVASDFISAKRRKAIEDGTDEGPDREETKLLYVAVTRARRKLDHEAILPLLDSAQRPTVA